MLCKRVTHGVGQERQDPTIGGVALFLPDR